MFCTVVGVLDISDPVSPIFQRSKDVVGSRVTFSEGNSVVLTDFFETEVENVDLSSEVDGSVGAAVGSLVLNFCVCRSVVFFVGKTVIGEKFDPSAVDMVVICGVGALFDEMEVENTSVCNIAVIFAAVFDSEVIASVVASDADINISSVVPASATVLVSCSCSWLRSVSVLISSLNSQDSFELLFCRLRSVSVLVSSLNSQDSFELLFCRLRSVSVLVSSLNSQDSFFPSLSQLSSFSSSSFLES